MNVLFHPTHCHFTTVPSCGHCVCVSNLFAHLLSLSNPSIYILFSSQVQDVTMEIQDLLQWLENTDLRLSSTRTVWGMPDSANERLNAHLVRMTSLIIHYITISA